MKVLILNNRYPSSSKPFVASYVKTIESLLAENHEVEHLVFQRNSSSKWGQILDLALYRLKVSLSKQFIHSEVIFANHFNLYWDSLKGRISNNHKLIIHWHGSELFGSKRFRNFESWQSDSRFISASHIVPSEYFKKEVLKEFPDLKSVSVIPSGGIDIDAFQPKRSSNSSGEIVVGFAGHLNEAKGADYLLHLAKQKSELEELLGKKLSFKAIRYGVKDETILGDLNEAGVKVLPPISKQMMPEFYQSLDVLIFPTRRKSESLGLVPLEAMACGVPVVCPDAFACPEYCVSGSSGELYEPESFEQFKAALIKVVGNLSEYKPRQVVLNRYSQKYASNEYSALISSKKSS